jgi:cobalt-zinc-cadmium efflux system outer membrane protein
MALIRFAARVMVSQIPGRTHIHEKVVVVCIYGIVPVGKGLSRTDSSLSPRCGHICPFSPFGTAGCGRSRERVGAAAVTGWLIPNPRFLFRKEDFTDHLNVGENSQTYWEGSQLLQISGKRGGRVAVAQQGMEQSRLQAEHERRQIILNVRESYWKAKASQSLAALYAQDADYFRQVIEYHEARFLEGKIAEVDLLRVRLQGEQNRAAAANAKLDSEKTLLMLAQEMNAAPNSSWVLSEDFEALEEPKPLPPGIDATSTRVEGQLAQQAIAVAEAQTRLQKANGRPDLLLTGGYKRDVDIDTPVAGVQFDLPLFNRNQGAVAAARAEEDAVREDYQATRNQLAAELGLAQREYEMRRDQYLQTFKPLREQAIEISQRFCQLRRSPCANLPGCRIQPPHCSGG